MNHLRCYGLNMAKTPTDIHFHSKPGRRAPRGRCGLKPLRPFLLAGILCLVAPLYADSFRCGSKLVRNGDSPQALLQRCGEPQSRASSREEFWFEGRLQDARVERWHYKPGKGRLESIVLIYRGEIIAIQTGER